MPRPRPGPSERQSGRRGRYRHGVADLLCHLLSGAAKLVFRPSIITSRRAAARRWSSPSPTPGAAAGDGSAEGLLGGNRLQRLVHRAGHAGGV